jgi:uncharacterized protein YidB (DUF937 family)
MGLLSNVIRTAVISALGAKLAKGRSPIVGALIALLATRMLSKTDDSKQLKSADPEQEAAPSLDGLGGLIDQFKRGGFEEIIKSWIGTGENKLISPNQLHDALGPKTVDNLAKESGLPREDLLSQLSRLLPDVIDKLTPNGQLPKREELLDEGADDEASGNASSRGRPAPS